MMTNAIFTLVVCACAAGALAAPRESVTFTNVDSVGLRGNIFNQTRTASFLGSDAGGAYTTRMVRVSGAVWDSFGTSTWAREAVIEITPPNGQPFVSIPLGQAAYVGQAVVEEGRYTVPVTPVTGGGLWTFRFAETYDDDPFGVDQTWANITFTLDDGVPPPIDPPIGGVTTVMSGVNSSGTPGSGSTVVTRAFTGPGIVNRVQVLGRYTVTGLVSTDTTTNVPSQARIRITPPAGSGVAPFDTAPVTSGFSTCLANALIDIPGLSGGGVQLAGTWTFEFYEAIDEPGVVDGVWQNVSFTLQNTNAPASVDIGVLPDGGQAVEESDFRTVAVTPQAGVVKWVRFSLPQEVSAANGSALDIDMLGTAAGPQNDFSIGLYSGEGDLIAWSYDTGPGDLPQISVGAGLRPREGNGLPFDGQNPGLSPQGGLTASAWPAVPAGFNYVAVCSGDDGALFTGAGWQVAPSTEANGPSATLRLRYYSTAPMIPPQEVIQLPTLTAAVRGTVTLGSDPGERSKWLRFTIPQNANSSTGRYLDIDTTQTLNPTHDTTIALYDGEGRLRAWHNDLNLEGGPTNWTARNSALSFGAATPTRDYRGDGNLPLANGRDGPLVAGVYYLHIGECCPGYGNDRFWVMTDYVTHTAPGPVKWNIYSNFNYACGPADIGGQGGLLGSDGRLDNNDFVVFIEQYFEQSSFADVGAQGGVATPDGNFDNNDFVVFIDRYFSAPASCR